MEAVHRDSPETIVISARLPLCASCGTGGEEAPACNVGDELVCALVIAGKTVIAARCTDAGRARAS